MFNRDFYPTPGEVIEKMLYGYEFSGKHVLEPSAGKGDIVDELNSRGADTMACETNEDLRMILGAKTRIIENDFMNLTSEKVSHIDFIVMNPPFSKDEYHIIHAWEIAPAGCTIIALCNSSTISERAIYRAKAQLRELVEQYGNITDLGECFSTAERKTDVEVSMIRLQKPGSSENEFEGFFIGEEVEKETVAGLMPYNFVRDIVNRYIQAMKIYDEQLEAGVRMSEMISGFMGYRSDKEPFVFTMTEGDKPVSRNNFKKWLQKQAWNYVFKEMHLEKYSTKGLKEKINKFVEQHQEIPFTMRNVYKMVQIVIETTGQRMEDALVEVFDRITERCDQNRLHVEGWKTNSHYLVNRKFIFPYGCNVCRFMKTIDIHSSTSEMLTDFEKALCYITGKRFEEIRTISEMAGRHPEAGAWNQGTFFRVKFYKKGTVHCEFVDKEVWEKYNKEVARIKGYPLYEAKEATSQKESKEHERREAETAKNYHPSI